MLKKAQLQRGRTYKEQFLLHFFIRYKQDPVHVTKIGVFVFRRAHTLFDHLMKAPPLFGDTSFGWTPIFECSPKNNTLSPVYNEFSSDEHFLLENNTFD